MTRDDTQRAACTRTFAIQFFLRRARRSVSVSAPNSAGARRSRSGATPSNAVASFFAMLPTAFTNSGTLSASAGGTLLQTGTLSSISHISVAGGIYQQIGPMTNAGTVSLAAAGVWSDDVAWWALLVALIATWVSGLDYARVAPRVLRGEGA